LLFTSREATLLSIPLTPEICLESPTVREAFSRGFFSLDGDKIVYRLHKEKSYQWSDPEEWVRCAVLAYLIVAGGYPPNRLEVEVAVPRRVPGDFADVVVFEDDRCRSPYLVVETKSDPQSVSGRRQGVEQAVGNAHSLRAPLALYDEGGYSLLLDTSGAYPAMEREQNRRGDRTRVPSQYSEEDPVYRYIAGDSASDIEPAAAAELENIVRRTHSLIWAGGKRDPLMAFDEWSKLLFAKVHDERTTPNGEPRQFQAGSDETATAVANRVHLLFASAAEQDKTIFPVATRINLSDEKIRDVVETLQGLSIVNTDADTIGAAFEKFFGTVFRGELGQYFTMRPIARFSVAAVGIDHQDYVIDPSAGSGGFLLEALLQGWHRIETAFEGQTELDRKKIDFALQHVFGIEIHEILARILKINLLLHHDGHTNIEGDRSCLDIEFLNPRLSSIWRGSFDRVVGNPPFGDTVKARDADLLGQNSLETFDVARGRSNVPSEHVILERGIEMLKPGGRLAFVLPDGLFNNQGEMSNCPAVRRLLVKTGVIEAIVSLPDFAFRKSGAQNKTSVLVYRKFTPEEKATFGSAYGGVTDPLGADVDAEVETIAIEKGLEALGYSVFLAEANRIGYTPTGTKDEANDLYRADEAGFVTGDQSGSILGELEVFRGNPGAYRGRQQPDCMAIAAHEMWTAHPSHRLDPKYFLFKLEEQTATPKGWVRQSIGQTMRRREEIARPQDKPDDPVVVLTVSQSGDLRAREAGKGRTPPAWLGMYFEEMPTKWFVARQGDVVFSGIDLWKGCIAVVPEELDGSLVSSEFPVYEIADTRLEPDFLSTLLRSRYYARAFRAITTGHSNRRRTQAEDFEALEICFPKEPTQQRQLVASVVDARQQLRAADSALREAMMGFSDIIDNRGDEEYEQPGVDEGQE
jgi:type I restriction enzyme M protein